MSFTFRTTPEIQFGSGRSRRAPESAARFGRRFLLVTGEQSLDRSGFLEILRGEIAKVGATFVRCPVAGEPEVSTVDEAARLCREAACDVVLAVGGGSVIDTAKALSAVATNGGSVLEYLEEAGTGRPIERPPLPVVAVPTTSGSGSEVTRNAVIRVADRQVKRSVRHDLLLPRVAVVDPDVAAAPRTVAASAGLDALTHLIEGYVSTGAQPTTDALALPGIRLALRGLRALAADRPTTDSREALSLASLWGGMVLANAGLGAVHGLVAPLGGRCRIPHGTGCACLLVETVRANLEALRARGQDRPALGRYAEVAAALECAGMEEALKVLGALRRDLGVEPLSSYGVGEKDVVPIVRDSHGGSMKYNPIALTESELEKVLRAAL